MSVIHSGTVEGPAEEADQLLGFAERNLLIWQAISKVYGELMKPHWQEMSKYKFWKKEWGSNVALVCYQQHLFIAELGYFLQMRYTVYQCCFCLPVVACQVLLTPQAAAFGARCCFVLKLQDVSGVYVYLLSWLCQRESKGVSLEAGLVRAMVQLIPTHMMNYLLLQHVSSCPPGFQQV